MCKSELRQAYAGLKKKIMIKRQLDQILKKKVGRGKAIMLVGPRQVGKTTLIKEQLEGTEYEFWDGDDPVVRNLLESTNTERLKELIGSSKVVFIDEAQRIKGIGLTLKLITDQFKHVQLWISGSSSFELADSLNESLTGRKWQYELLPISWAELENHIGYLKAEQQLQSRLIYGFYPDVLNNPGDEVEILKNLVDSYLYKDLLSFGNVRKPELLEKLVQALALQMGNEVNYNELANIIGADKNTVERYINVLEKGFVIFKLRSYNRNVRNEIRKNRKIYFYDNGLRNTVIGNFSDIELRNDKGALWENFLISDRIKQLKYSSSLAKSFFWRTTQQQEVDYVEEEAGKLVGYEFKWKLKKNLRLPLTFTKAYPAESRFIDRSNFRDFVLPKVPLDSK